MDDSIIIQRIKKRMEKLGLNARRLAEKSNVGKSFVYDILSGKSRNPTSSKLALISKELGVSISYLVGDNDIDLDTQNYAIISSLNENVNNPQMLLSSEYFDMTASQDLHTFSVDDNSMSPILYTRDIVIIDTNAIHGITVGIFVIKHGESFLIRRLQHLIGSKQIRIIAENEKYNSSTEDIDKLQLIGKVQYFFRKL